MLIKLQRDLKIVGANATKVEKINEMAYGETKAIFLDSPKCYIQGQRIFIYSINLSATYRCINM